MILEIFVSAALVALGVFSYVSIMRGRRRSGGLGINAGIGVPMDGLGGGDGSSHHGGGGVDGGSDGGGFHGGDGGGGGFHGGGGSGGHRG